MAHQPNVIFVFADQLRYDALGCNGNRFVRTPHLDAMARRGMVLDNAFSSCPICAPYRGQLLTGRYSHANGVMCNEYKLWDGQPTLARVLSERGYRTAFVGKWHLGYGPYPAEKRMGFEDLIAYNCTHHYYGVEYWHNESGPHEIREYAPRGETELALDTITRYRTETPDRPFCLAMSWGPPHWTDYQGGERDYGCYPREYDTYNPDELEIPENVPGPLRPYARREFADYYAMVTSLDDCMGRVFEGLEKLGLTENTIICFTSDHGDHLGAHGAGKPGYDWIPAELRDGKATPYEESIHLPFIVQCPETIPAHVRSDAFFSSVDVMPTLLGLCGAKIPGTVQGCDLSEAFLGRKPESSPHSIYLQILGPGWPSRGIMFGHWRGVRTERYVYARYRFPEIKRVLFDRRTDPGEMNNLAGKPEAQPVLEQMEKMLQEWIQKTDDPFDTAECLPATGMLDIGQQLSSESGYELLPPAYREAILRYKPGAGT
jgi:arylsulfatase A-like enzyme